MIYMYIFVARLVDGYVLLSEYFVTCPVQRGNRNVKAAVIIMEGLSNNLCTVWF